MQEAFNPAIRAPVVSNTARTIVDYTEQEVKTLYKLRSIFPLDPFPTIITIQPDCISIVHSLFNLWKRLITIKMDDIFTVEVDSGLFFADVRIQQKQALTPIVELQYFWKQHALKARRIIQGLLVVQDKNLKIKDLRADELINYLEEIGSTHTSG